MRHLFGPRFAPAALLLLAAAFGAQVGAAQMVGPGHVLISEFRLSGPGGDSDEYIEFYCNRDAECDISDYVIRGFDPDFGDFTIPLPDSLIIPARGHLLVGDSSQYTLDSYAFLDLDVACGCGGFDVFIDGEGFQLLDPTETVVIDSVGFAGGGNSATYVEGTGLEQSSARPADQYAYVRKMGTADNGRPRDTNNNAGDFVLVSVTGTPHAGVTAPPVLGAPGPQGFFSPADVTDSITSALVEPGASQGAPPNRVRTGSGDSGTLSIRRSITNDTTQFIEYLAFRVVDITTLNSPPLSGSPPPQAQLRLVTSDNAEVFTNSQGRTVSITGTVLEFDGCGCEPSQPNGGGLNTTVAVSDFGGLAPGETIDVQFMLNVVKAGAFRFYINVEAVTSDGEEVDLRLAGHKPSVARRALKTAAHAAPRHLTVRKGGVAGDSAAPFSKAFLKKTLPVRPEKITPAPEPSAPPTRQGTPAPRQATPAAEHAGTPVGKAGGGELPAQTTRGGELPARLTSGGGRKH